MSERPRGPARPESATSQKAGEAADQLDQRFVVASGLRRQINKVFPTHWSFLLGEIALYSFIVLLLTGTYLAFFFDPSMQEVEYNGIFTNLRDVPMSRAYESALDINFEVRGGMLARQIHHLAHSESVARHTSDCLSSSRCSAMRISGILPSRRSGWP